MTILLALIHAFRTNRSFNPELLYLGAILIDYSIVEAVFL